ncbi:hypothetical protein F3J23_14680 [Chryseobacterium sp. Tr-659]|uniref:hypothetical protein n=1 Tax=Chryseobacterium sp. Tr-659 TaxID=2608340 RepID=UPI00141EF5B6|nr:hypothetical protein [Chryseobacterium sp. Tr-659]NIF06692.1 hypothetical protein [Chryseobacterium sp. Tr-659]
MIYNSNLILSLSPMPSGWEKQFGNTLDTIYARSPFNHLLIFTGENTILGYTEKWIIWMKENMIFKYYLDLFLAVENWNNRYYEH